MNYEKYCQGQKLSFQDALNEMVGRRNGTITSYATPWPKVNDASTDGFEWHSLTVIGGRPGTGKTLIKDQIIRETAKHNPGQTIRIYEFNFEMVGATQKQREFSAVLEKPYKYVKSACGNKISDEDLKTCFEYAKTSLENETYPVDTCYNPVDVDEFQKLIEWYMQKHAVVIDEKRVYTKTVITVDHANLFKLSANQKSKTDMLYELGEVITDLKKRFPISFIVLSQLGRNVESPERNQDGKYGNYILETDLFGGDALFQHADLVMGFNRPSLKFISFYGPERYIMDDPDILVCHFLKCRNGDTRMSFFKSEYHKMRIVEMAVPPAKQERRISTS